MRLDGYQRRTVYIWAVLFSLFEEMKAAYDGTSCNRKLSKSHDLLIYRRSADPTSAIRHFGDDKTRDKLMSTATRQVSTATTRQESAATNRLAQ
ncbi:unnamed protein product [Sphagnum jensenii]